MKIVGKAHTDLFSRVTALTIVAMLSAVVVPWNLFAPHIQSDCSHCVLGSMETSQQMSFCCPPHQASVPTPASTSDEPAHQCPITEGSSEHCVCIVPVVTLIPPQASFLQSKVITLEDFCLQTVSDLPHSHLAEIFHPPQSS